MNATVTFSIIVCSAVLAAFGGGVHAAEDIDVFGGSGFAFEILNNDTTPTAADGTDFGSATVGGSSVTKIYRIRNNGNENLTIAGGTNSNTAQFTLAGLPGPTQPIAPGGAVTFTIQFAPTTAAQHNATIGIINTTPGENPFTFAITGEGIGSPEIVVEGKYELSGSFGNVTSGSTTPQSSNGTLFLTTVVGSSRSHDFRIRNTGNSTLTVSMINNSGHFSQTGWGTSVVAGATDNFLITFSPTSRGAKSATITIDTNDADEDPFTFVVLGNAVAPDIEVRRNGALIVDGDTTPSEADGTDFGTKNVDGEMGERTFAITNTGDIDLDVTTTTLSGTGKDHFYFVNPITSPVTLGAGGGDEYQLRLRFDPLSVGVKEAMVTILSNDPDETPFTFAVRGTGAVYPEINLQGRSTSAIPYANIPDGSAATNSANGTLFADTELGSDTLHVFRIQNTGNETLFHESITSSDPGQFLISNEENFTTAGNENTFVIRFIPQSYGTHTATITIVNDDPDENPYTFKVSGVGLAPDIEVFGGSGFGLEIPNGDDTPNVSDGTDLGTLNATGAVVVKNFRIRNVGTESLIVTGAAVDGLDADFHYTLAGIPSPVEPIPPGGSDDFSIIFDPAWDGPLPGTVRLLTSDPVDPVFTFAIAGTGVGTPDIEIRRARTPEVIGNGATLDLGEIPVGDIGTYSIEIVNEGDGLLDLQFSRPSSIGLATTQGSLPSQIRPGESREIQIQFTPGDVGPQMATLTIDSDDPDESPFGIHVEATGLGPDMVVLGGANLRSLIADGDTTPGVSDGTDFGDVLLGSTPITRTFRIKNDGNRALTVVTGSLSGDTGDFSLSGMPDSSSPVFPVTTDDFSITFEPTSLGVKTVTVSILSDDPDENPYTFVVSGTAVDTLAAPDIEVRGGGIAIPSGDSTPSVADGSDFGTAVEGGAPVSRTFTIINTGDAALESVQTSVSHPQVSVAGGVSSGIGPGRSINFTVTIDPASPGTVNAVVSIVSDDPNENPYVFLVRLEVEPLADAPSPVISDFDFDATTATGSVRFPTRLGKTYVVTSSASMASGTWLQVPGTASLSGTGNEESFHFMIDIGSGGATRFYRIEEQ